jgi:D-3-phosphoglycerate dehydrogenase
MQIVIAGQLDPQSVAALASSHEVLTVEHGEPPRTALERCDVLVTRGHFRVSDAILADMPQLRLVVKAGSGVDNIDLPAAAARGIPVETTPCSTVSVAELALGLLLSVRRRICFVQSHLKAGNWNVKYEWPGHTLAGSTIGIIGFGRIGREAARLAAAFSMRVLAWDRSPQKAEKAAAAAAIGVRFAALDDLLSASHAVSLHLPATSSTAGIIGARELALMRPEAVLINTGRASVVDRAALVEALRNGRLTGAGLDVFHQEPIDPADPLLSLPQVVCTPHVGAQTVETMAEIGRNVCRVIESFSHAETTSMETP